MANEAAGLPVTIRLSEFPRDRDAIVELFRAYQQSLSVDLCFQGFDDEIAQLPGAYAAPSGRLLLASIGAEPVGCVALRRHDPETGEMKRLYVRSSARGHGIGRRLVEQIVIEARMIGYRRLSLDTLPEMVEAQALYEVHGFRTVEPYTFNPVPGAKYLGLTL